MEAGWGGEGLRPPDEVAAWLASPEVQAALVVGTHERLTVTADHATQLGDPEDNPWSSSRTLAELAVWALTEMVDQARHQPPVDEAAATRAIADLTYKDWELSLVKLTTGQLAVRVVAHNPDVGDPTRTFTSSRTVIIRRSVEEAAFRGVMEIEEHEAAERFRRRGRRVMSIHDGANAPRPKLSPGVHEEAAKP